MSRSLPLLLASLLVAGAQTPTTWLGVGLLEVSPQMAQEIGLDTAGGALVANIAPLSPAQKAGIMPGEVIVKFAGDDVTSVQQIAKLVRQTTPGQSVTVELISTRGRRTVQAVMEERRAAPNEPRPTTEIVVVEPLDFDIPRPVMVVRNRSLGATLEAVEGQLAEYFGTPSGVLVREVRADSAAETAGLRAGDVIVEANKRAVKQPEELRRAMSEAGESVELRVVRERRSRLVSVKLGADSSLGRPFTRRFNGW
ncbi:MAG: PDZ domain-containing protein [Acidobacteria bacterium]|nr:PDZ domain-containing protein [Acidobacteriota bacterium]